MNRRRLLLALRRFHLGIGLASALYFLLIALTGVALNHRQGWRLEDRYVSRTWLPSSYRPGDGREVRADIAIGDLHSGLIFGKVGGPILDVVATVWLLSIVSGICILVIGRSVRNGELASLPHRNGLQPVKIEPEGNHLEPVSAEQAVYAKAASRK